MSHLTRINSGCGRDYREGWWNTDIAEDIKVEQRMDIRKDRYKMGKGTVDVVYCSGVLEQVLENEQLVHAFNEAWRVLKEGGEFQIVVPNAEHSIAFQDPFDVRKFTPKTFQYFVDGEREHELYGKLYGFKTWSTCSIQENHRNILEVTLVK